MSFQHVPFWYGFITGYLSSTSDYIVTYVHTLGSRYKYLA